jgi:hypothetical protein
LPSVRQISKHAALAANFLRTLFGNEKGRRWAGLESQYTPMKTVPFANMHRWIAQAQPRRFIHLDEAARIFSIRLDICQELTCTKSRSSG